MCSNRCATQEETHAISFFIPNDMCVPYLPIRPVFLLCSSFSYLACLTTGGGKRNPAGCVSVFRFTLLLHAAAAAPADACVIFVIVPLASCLFPFFFLKKKTPLMRALQLALPRITLHRTFPTYIINVQMTCATQVLEDDFDFNLHNI